MAKIKYINKKQGMTLIELLMYMTIFTFIVMSVMSSVFFLQKIIQNNNQNYYIKNQIYTNLNILQQYLYKNNVLLDSENLKIINKNGTTVLTQRLENNQIKNIYNDKAFTIMENIKFVTYGVNLIEKDKLLKFEISWRDERGKLQNFVEYIVVINHNL